MQSQGLVRVWGLRKGGGVLKLVFSCSFYYRFDLAQGKSFGRCTCFDLDVGFLYSHVIGYYFTDVLCLCTCTDNLLEALLRNLPDVINFVEKEVLIHCSYTPNYGRKKFHFYLFYKLPKLNGLRGYFGSTECYCCSLSFTLSLY